MTASILPSMKRAAWLLCLPLLVPFMAVLALYALLTLGWDLVRARDTNAEELRAPGCLRSSRETPGESLAKAA